MVRSLLFLFLSFVALECASQNHRALLVGIANYPETSGWRRIHSDNDVELISGILSDTYQIRSLIDSQATYKNIEKELAALESATNPGDTILISFSCHGQQMLAEGLEESDYLDEALIPYDAMSEYSSTYVGEKHLRDDDLSRFISNISSKAGDDGFVMVLLDACHSGDSFKDGDTLSTAIPSNYRGGYPVFGPINQARQRIKKEHRDLVKIEKAENQANILYISACQSYQLNLEMTIDKVKWFGSLSYAFFEAYRKHGLADLSLLCREIRDNILSYNKATSQCPEFASSIGSLDLGDAMDAEFEQEDSDFVTDEPESHWGYFAAILFVVLVIVLFLWKRK